MKRLFTLIIFLFLLTGAAACRAETALTLMVYLCGSNLETDAGAASADLEEMMTHYPSDGSLRVIVLASGARQWQNGISPEKTAIYELTGAGLEKLCTLAPRSMGDPASLTALLEYGYTHAPARDYALILWDHGAGPAVGLCFDERYPTGSSMDGLTLTELSTALRESPANEDKLSWIGFDACLMASLETACTVAPYAEYMIASQETEPASGWDYSFLEQIAGDASGADTGLRVIESYFASQPDTLAPLTLSCVELRHMADVTDAMDDLFNSLHLTLDEKSYPTFADCRVNTKSLGCSTAYEYDLIDLTDLMEVYQDSALADCTDLLALLDQTIVASRANMPYVNGLSIHYPHYGTQEASGASASEGYDAFMADMSAIRLGEPLTDWSDPHQPEAALFDGVTLVSMALTEQQAKSLDSATLFILKQMAGGDYQLVYRTNDFALSEEHVISAAYEDQALYIVDAQGNVVSDALPYYLQEDAVILNGDLTKDIDHFLEDDWCAFVRLIFRKDAQGKYRLAEIQERTDDPTIQGKATIRLEDYQSLSIYTGSVTPVYGADGSLLPPSQWDSTTMIYGWWFDLADFPGWSIDFLSQQDGRSRYALLQITDTQNQVVCSELTPIPNPNITELPVEAQTLVDNELCRFRFTGAQQVLGTHPTLRLLFTCENRSSEAIDVDVRMLQLDDMVVARNSASSSAIAPGECKLLEAEVKTADLEARGIQAVEHISMNLVVNRNYTDTLLEQRATCSFAADLRTLAPNPTQPEVIDEASWDGLDFTLHELAVEGDELTGLMTIRNATDAPVVVDTAYFYLDDLQLQGHLTDAMSAITLQPGAAYRTGFEISLTGYANDQYRPESCRNRPEALGMTALHTLGVGVQHEDWDDSSRLTFTLPEPFDLPTDAAGQRLDAWPVLYDEAGVTIRLADFTWEPDSDFQAAYRYLNLFIDNATSYDVDLFVPWRLREDSPITFKVNGHSLDYVHSPVFPAHTRGMESIWYAAGEDFDPMETIEMLLHITSGDGRDDWLRVHIEATGEPETDGSYRILHAEQLRVTATPIN